MIRTGARDSFQSTDKKSSDFRGEISPIFFGKIMTAIPAQTAPKARKAPDCKYNG
jgi:hypothetical protein